MILFLSPSHGERDTTSQKPWRRYGESMIETGVGREEMRLRDTRGRELHAQRVDEQVRMDFQGREGELIGRVLVSRDALLRGEPAESEQGGQLSLRIREQDASLSLLARGGQPLIQMELDVEQIEDLRALLTAE